MTDELDNAKGTNKNKEQETIESDIEQDESVGTDDKSNVTTDDEFYNELMSVPPEYDDHLIPDECKDEIAGIEHLTLCLNRRYNSCPIVFTGTLKDALKEAFSPQKIRERRPLLIYVNNDKSVYTNLFCKQLLCNDKIIEFLLNNYVLWAWDVTFQSNGEKLNEMYKIAFPQSNTDQQIGMNSIDQYPLLIGIRHKRNGDDSFTRLIDGSNKRPVADEFLARLIQFKDEFDLNEEEFEKSKEETKHYIMDTLSRNRDFNHRSLHHNNHDLYSSSSMNYNRNPTQYSRLLNNDNMTFPSTFLQLNRNPDDGDDEDDDDDFGQTPTVEHPSPKFSK